MRVDPRYTTRGSDAATPEEKAKIGRPEEEEIRPPKQATPSPQLEYSEQWPGRELSDFWLLGETSFKRPFQHLAPCRRADCTRDF